MYLKTKMAFLNLANLAIKLNDLEEYSV